MIYPKTYIAWDLETSGLDALQELKFFSHVPI